MKFKLDENLPEVVRGAFAERGLDAHTVADEQLSGARDEAVLQACIAEQRILVTLDLDFPDIRTYPPGSHPGIWVLRPPARTFKAIEKLLLAALRLSATEPPRGRLWVIDERRIRIRSPA